MRHRQSIANAIRRPVVAVVVDGTTTYGRNIFRGVMRYANAQRKWVIHSELRRLSFKEMEWVKCDAAIVAGVELPLLRTIHRRSGHVIHCSAAGDVRGAATVCIDDIEAGRLAAEHLLDCRLKRFGFYGRRNWAASDSREIGFRRAIEAHGFSCLTSPVEWAVAYTRKRRDASSLVKWLKSLPRPIGILAVDDSAANNLAGACLKANIGVPDELAIIGVNNDDLLCDSAWPPLSSVEADFSRVGYTAAMILERLFSGEEIPPAERAVRLQPLGVVKRMSTDVLAVDDPQLAVAVRYIREHACEPHAMEAVLRDTAVGRRWLERQFVKKLGRTPHDEILRVRMETAKRLLLQPGLQIDDIALRCGLSSAQSLCRAFANFFDITPAAFRRNSVPFA